MELDRLKLLAVVQKLKPALASKDMIESLTHVWFGEKYVSAHNTDLGTRIRFSSELRGGVRGDLLLGLLTNSNADNVVITPGKKKGQIVVKLDKTRAELALLPPEEDVWKFPEPKKDEYFELTEEVLEAINFVLVATGADASMPEQLGINLLADKKQLNMFTTDSQVLGRGTVSKPANYSVEVGTKIIVPVSFVDQLVKYCGVGSRISVFDDYIVARADRIKVYSRLLSSDRDIDFKSVVARHMPDSAPAFEVPKELEFAMARASVLLDTGGDITLEIKDGSLFIRSASDGRGAIRDEIRLDGEFDDIEVRANPAYFKRALPLECNTMEIGDKAVVFRKGENLIYMVSVKS